MKKILRFDANTAAVSPNPKQNQVFVKIAVGLILIGLAYRLYFSSYVRIPPPVAGDGYDLTPPSPSLSPPPSVVADPTVSGRIPANRQGSGKCDIFTGEWVRDATGPRYTDKSCTTIEHHQNCMRNGRPDSDYIYWRWSPYNCELPRFDPKQFLDVMRKKSMAFIGDSISRNHVQSLLCILSQVEQAVEVYHDEEYRSKRWFFRSHEFTLSVIWSPFLTKAKISEDNDGHASDVVRLHLDEPDPVWAGPFGTFDYVEIAGGKWFLKTAVYYENDTVVGCHNCRNENVTEVGFDYAYRRALRAALGFVTRPEQKIYVLFRTTTPDHFENGEWDTGGYCNRTGPFRDGEVGLRDVDAVMRGIEVEEFGAAAAVAANRSVLKLLDTTRLSLLRPDGHPGPYRAFRPFDGNDAAKVQNDCLHWCLPGPIDSWNDLVMKMLLGG